MKHTDTTEKSQLTNAVNGLRRPRAEHVYYAHHHDKFWMQDNHGRWIKYSRDALKTRLRLDFYLNTKPQDELPSELDEEVDRIMREQAVEVALPLAGYMSGLHQLCGMPVLITDSPTPLLPKEGDHGRFLKRLQRMFGTEQAELFCGWLHFALADYYEFLHQQTGRNVGMALVISGTSGIGKTFLVDLLTECFGGRRAQPAQHAKGGTTFNHDLIARELQVFDDDGMGDAYKERKIMGDFVKQMVAVRDQRCHPKGRDAFMVRVFWRLIFCLNDEAENLQVLPPLERGVKDKVMMLKAGGSLLNEGEEGRPRRENWAVLIDEMACFICWLLEKFEVDETLRDTRFGTKAWQHPDLVEAVDTFAPELKLLHMIDEWGQYREGKWEGTARSLEVLLKGEESPTSKEAIELLRSAGSAGKYLGKLATKRSDRVMKLGKDREKVQLWRVVESSFRHVEVQVPSVV